MFTQERMREIIWELGQKFPIPQTEDQIDLSMVHPRLGHISWHISDAATLGLRLQRGDAVSGAPYIARIYDVTDIIFDGFNAHRFFDLRVPGASGTYYFGVDRTGRNYLAEVGLQAADGSFHSLSRSNTVFFDRDRPSGNYQVEGLFAGGRLHRVFPVENIFDARVYERLNREVAEVRRREPLRAAVVFLNMDRKRGFESPLGSFVRETAIRFEKFGGQATFFTSPDAVEQKPAPDSLADAVAEESINLRREILAEHAKEPFHLIHCHDWYSASAGAPAAAALDIAMILSLHSTEHERLQGNRMGELSAAVFAREMEAVRAADLVVVPHSSTRQQVIALYHAGPENVVIIPETLTGVSSAGLASPQDVKRRFGIPPEAPVVLFSGEVSHAAGADLLVDALPTVCNNHRTVHFILAGDGPLRGELQARAARSGIAHRCRFLGDIPRETFDDVLSASDFVVIPARTWQGEGLAQAAIGAARPVLTTRQAGINCIVHGQNGLVTFDNPGSIVWGIQELLFNPMQGAMMRTLARRTAGGSSSPETAAAQLYICYEMALRKREGGKVV